MTLEDRAGPDDDVEGVDAGEGRPACEREALNLETAFGLATFGGGSVF